MYILRNDAVRNKWRRVVNQTCHLFFLQNNSVIRKDETEKREE